MVMMSAVVEGRTVLLTATMTLLVLATRSAASSQDQYEQQPRLTHTDTADGNNQLHRVPLSHTGYHRFNLIPLSQPSSTNQERNVPELQVGCADVSVDVQFKKSLKNDHQTEVVPQTRSKRETQNHRERRDYIQWYGETGSTTIRQNFPSQYVRQTYQLSSALPYWVPIWGNPRRVPVFFPAKPILFNPGFPFHNRPSVQNPATDMPGTEAPVTEGPVKIGNRINVDDPQVWGVVEADTPRTLPAAPAARPRRPPTPPLIHRPSITEDTITAQSSAIPNPQPIQPVQNLPPVTQRPTTASPIAAASSASRQNPLQSTTQQGQGPDRCVWAIISCCSPISQQVRSNCFEQLGCPGAFWDVNPCSREVTAAAVNAVQKFYGQS